MFSRKYKQCLLCSGIIGLALSLHYVFISIPRFYSISNKVTTSVESTAPPKISSLTIATPMNAPPTTSLMKDNKISVESSSKPQIWIHVRGYGEGISKWRHSVSQLLGLVKILNATLVEPCMKSGRLYSCGNFKVAERVPLSEVYIVKKYMLPIGRGRPSLLGSHEEFEQYEKTANLTIHKLCSSRSKRGCDSEND